MDVLDTMEKVVTVAAAAVGAVTGLLAVRGGRASRDIPAGRAVPVATPVLHGATATVPDVLAPSYIDPVWPATGTVPSGVVSAQRALRSTGVPIALLLFWVLSFGESGEAIAWLILVAFVWYLFNLALAWALGRGSRFGRGTTWVAMVAQMPFYFLTDLIILLVMFNTSSHLAGNMLGSIAIAAYTVMVIMVMAGLAKPSGAFFAKEATPPRPSR